MALYVKRLCPNCQYVLEGYTHDYKTIGTPFTICPNCETAVRLSHVNEWDLMSPLQKKHYLLSHIWTSLLWTVGGLVVGMLIGAVFLGVDVTSPRLAGREPGFIAINIILSAATAFSIRSVLFKRQIRESRKRLQNDKYRQTLCSIGISEAQLKT